MELTSGSRLSRYRIGDRIGAGGMGVVYRALDTRLERTVALKLLPPDAVGDAGRRERFVREAKAASALQHPHIVTVFDIDRVATPQGEIDVIAMELVEGEPLDRRIARGPLAPEEAVALAAQLADAVAAAHRAGIVHRDIKPGNVMLTADGQVKLLDFGLARTSLGEMVDPQAATVSDNLTAPGALVGTLAYMSPEQAMGRPVDARSDVFALGSVLYEMLSGKRPFAGPSSMDQLLAVVRDPPPPLRPLCPQLPGDLETVIDRCLEKEPDRRYPSAVELHAELLRLRDRLLAPPAGPSWLRRPAVAGPLLGLLLAAVAAGGWGGWRAWKRQQARAQLPRLEQLVDGRQNVEAYLLARELAPVLGEDRELERLLRKATYLFTVRSEPSGATVAFRAYTDREGPWIGLGTTPVEGVRLPTDFLRWRLGKEGFETLETAPNPTLTASSILVSVELQKTGEAPPGMVRIPAGTSTFGGTEPLPLEPFWLDRLEVTNSRFRDFVAAGGYTRQELWQEPFVLDGKTLSWEEAMARFVDATGRPGPSTWELGGPPEGQDDYPAAGVSWYEAAAFARWAGAELPTIHHWQRAAERAVFSDIVRLSNFGGEGTVPVGSAGGLGPFGTEDMAGNVFEWCSNEGTDGRRYLAGGAWNEPPYTYASSPTATPFDRQPNRGFRLARYDAPLAPEVLAPVVRKAVDWEAREPISDELFAAVTSIFAYQKGDLAAAVESVDDSAPHFRRERVSFAAAYGGERIPAELLLPRTGVPPFQVVIYFPTSLAESFGTSEELEELRWFEFVVRSGRAVFLPVFKNTYERRIPGWEYSRTGRRDVVVQWVKDLGRAIDYLESRPDIDARRVGFFGNSLGAVYAPVLLAVEPRVRAALVLGGGYLDAVPQAEIDPINYLPRVHAPTMMLSGRDDFLRPPATHQAPYLRRLGVPEDQKRLVLLEGGHVPSDWRQAVREALAWLDRWLGPVEQRL